MKFLLWFAGWATLAFIAIWFIADPWQNGLAALAGRIVAPPGSEIEFMQLQLFYPFDIGIYIGLCMASTWAPLANRLRSLGIGVPIMAVLELVSLVAAMKVMLGAVGPDGTIPADRLQEVMRFSTGLIRVTGLIAAAGVWLVLLGREKLSLTARTWLGSGT